MATLHVQKYSCLMSLMSLRGRKAVEYFMHFQGWNLSWDKRKKRSHKMSKRLIETKQSIKNLVVEREAVAIELHHLRPEFPKMAVQANTLIIIRKSRTAKVRKVYKNYICNL
ncbi:uncharacterized protein LOC112451796 isoform X1 [Temnothorax curvispinosus]|uniref:Uncharacterized protein LOC112451796 isoform X1 n=1 Tax=Temnothorax curvispinosus TaxID=300111 RepID=A0A6J1PD39_9HYME|nr:uncharacterized protein LOC112451796 isoform X1 [Temnothorax curvispinosus]